MSHLPLRALIALSLAFFACDGGDTKGGTDDTDTPAETDETDVVETDVVETDEEEMIAYADMNREQRLDYMATTVLPQMRDLFQAYDATAFAGFGCATCHGGNMVEADYQMPNALSSLEFAKFPYSASTDPEEAAWGAFMETEVLPTMATLVGREPFNPATNPEGFACFDCHNMPQ